MKTNVKAAPGTGKRVSSRRVTGAQTSREGCSTQKGRSALRIKKGITVESVLIMLKY